MGTKLLQCGVKRRQEDKLCFTQDELICYLCAILDLYKIKINNDIGTMSRPQLWHTICSLMQTYSRQHEKKWLHDTALRSKILQTCPLLAQSLLLEALLPVFAGDEHTKWLPAINIQQIIHQQCPTDLFFEGIFSADWFYATKNRHAGKPDKRQIYENMREKKKWAAILNIAVRNRAGEHWIALFKDNSISPQYLEYYDSLGDKMSMRREYGRNLRKIVEENNLILKQVQTRHQTDEYMCGMYACYYVLARAYGLSFNAFRSNIVTHNEIKAFRSASIID